MKNSVYVKGRTTLVFYDGKVFKSLDSLCAYLVTTCGHTPTACKLICSKLPSIDEATKDSYLEEVPAKPTRKSAPRATKATTSVKEVEEVEQEDTPKRKTTTTRKSAPKKATAKTSTKTVKKTTTKTAKVSKPAKSKLRLTVPGDSLQYINGNGWLPDMF